MKSPTALLAVSFFLSCVPLIAQQGPPPWAGQGKARHNSAETQTDSASDDLAALEKFLTMSDAELDAMQAAIARVLAMSPEERTQIREQIAAFRALPAEQRTQVRAGWGWHNAQDRADWRAMMQAKSPEERTAIQTELQALPPYKRQERRRELLQQWRTSRSQDKASPAQ